jgi:hypothetical protein
MDHIAQSKSQFAADTDVKQATTSWLQTLDTYFFCNGIQALVVHWNRWLMSVMTL